MDAISVAAVGDGFIMKVMRRTGKDGELGPTFELHVFGSNQPGMTVNNRLAIGEDPVNPGVIRWAQLCMP